MCHEDALNDAAVLREHDEQQARVIAEAARARYQGHPVGCQCARCAVAVIRALGFPATLGPALESSPRYQRMLETSHECSEDSAA